MKNKKLIGVAAVVVVALSGAVAVAAGGFGSGRDPERMNRFVTWRVNDTLDQLEATDAQRQKVLAVKDRLLDQVQASFGQHAQTHELLLSQWQSPRPDAARLHALVDQRAEEMKRIGHQAVDAAIEVHQTLTPEQRAQLIEELESYRGGRGHHR